MTRKQKKLLARVLAALALLVLAWAVPAQGPARAALWLAPYAVAGWDVLWRAARNIVRGQVFDENFLMAVATVGAFGCGEYPEGAAVMLFYQVGELFQSVAVGRSRRSISRLMDIRPDYAHLLRDGQTVRVDPEEAAVGDVILVRPGEKIPLDGVVLNGAAALDTAALTGESMPWQAGPGDEVLSGCVDLSGVLEIRVTRPYGQSTVARILELVESAAEKKAKAERFITRFARYYTPAVVGAALALFLLPTLLLALLPELPAWLAGTVWSDWLHRGLVFLVVSCPCALVISIPLSFFGGIGGAARQGILVKGGNCLEALARTGVVVFDKTGTLTQGDFQVTRVCPAEGVGEEDLLALAALAERHSGHPIAQSLKQAWKGEGTEVPVTGVEERPGLGVTALVDGRRVAVGGRKLMGSEGVACPPCEEAGTAVHVAADGTYLGFLLLEDAPKPSAAAAVAELKRRGVRTVMLTGDRPAVGEAAARRLGLDEVHAGLLPAGKVDRVEQLLKETPAGRTLAFVGDGVNDAPVLARADVGIAMGAMGSDAAIEAADVVLMDDDPAKVVRAMDLSRRCLRIVRENIVFSLGVKGAVLVLSAAGVTGMWAAVFADVGVMVLAILNAGRMLRK